MDNVFVTDLPDGLQEHDVAKIFGSYGTVVSCKVVSKAEQDWTTALVRFSSAEEARNIVESLNNNIPHGLTAPVTLRFANSPGSRGGNKRSGGAWGGARYAPYPTAQAMPAMPVMMHPAAGAGGNGTGAAKGQGKGAKGAAEMMCETVEESGYLPGHGADPTQLYEVFVFGLPADTTNIHLYRMFSPFGQISPKGCTAINGKGSGVCKGFGFVNYLSPESAELAIQTLNGAELPGGKVLSVQIKGPGKNAGESQASPKKSSWRA